MMERGRVRFLSDREAYGFIEREGYGQDVFVHRADVERGDLSEGDTVKFEISSAGRGPRARKIKVLESGGDKTEK
jgi:CspA family cold shock protein